MKKIDLNFNFKTFDGSEVDAPITDDQGKITGVQKVNVGKEVAGILARLNEGDAIKYVSWAIDWFKGNPVYLDESDFKKFRDIIEKTQYLNNLMKYNILSYIDKVKDEDVKK